jgi:hypothetical protein
MNDDDLRGDPFLDPDTEKEKEDDLDELVDPALEEEPEVDPKEEDDEDLGLDWDPEEA